MTGRFYNVANIYGVHVSYNEWDSRDHWELALDDMKNIGAVLISNEWRGGTNGCEDTLKAWEDCAEDIDRFETEIEDLKGEILDIETEQETRGELLDQLIDTVENWNDKRNEFKRFKRVRGYHYDLLIDLEKHAEYTGNNDPDDDYLRALLKDYSASGQGELDTVRIVEIDKCPNWVEEIADLDYSDLEDLGGMKVTTNDEHTYHSSLVPFLIDQGFKVSKRHWIKEINE